VTATCPAGHGSVSGGFGFGGIVTGFNRTGTGWIVGGFNDLMTPQELAVTAYCSPNVTAAAETVVPTVELEWLADARRRPGPVSEEEQR